MLILKCFLSKHKFSILVLKGDRKLSFASNYYQYYYYAELLSFNL